MKKSIKNAIKRTSRAIGYDIRRISAQNDPTLQLLTIIKSRKLEIVFDIGANTGQFATSLFQHGFNGTVVSFEPTTQAYRDLVGQAAARPNWIVHDRCALGSTNGSVDIFISGNSVSSSLLPMLREHEKAAPGSAYVGSEVTPVRLFDDIFLGYLPEPNARFMIKVDTQGSEWDVFDGAHNALSRAQVVMCELSLVPLYQGQHLWLETKARLETYGFSLWALNPAFSDAESGQTLQIDAIFVKHGRNS